MGSFLGHRESPDFIAELKFRTTEEGGRQTPAFSRYRPHVKFPFSKHMTSGEQIYLDKEIVFPGDSVTAIITMLDHVAFANTLEVGQEFEFGEGRRIIGEGKIVEIVNEKLRKPANNN